MYKKIKTWNFDSNNPFDEMLSKYMTAIFDKIELALWKIYLKNTPVEKVHGNQIIQYYLDNHLQLQWDTDLFNEEATLPIVIELLDYLLTSKMEDFLREDLRTEEKLEEPNTINLTFSQFLEQYKKSESNLVDYTNELLYKNIRQESGEKPLYFLLYRLRNNLLIGYESRNYSIKHIRKSLEYLYKKIEDLLREHILYTHCDRLTKDSITQLTNQFQLLIISRYANELRIGKNADEGERIYSEAISQFKDLDEIKELASSYSQKLEDLIKGDMNVSILLDWYDSYSEDIREAASCIQEIPLKVLSNQRVSMTNTLRNMIVNRIIVHTDFGVVLEQAFNALDNEQIKHLVNQMCLERLNDVVYTVALHVKHLKADNSFSRLEFRDYVFLSDALFEGWQSEITKGFDIPHRISAPDEPQKEYTWVLVNNTKAANGDLEMAITRAENKLKSRISLMYFFATREEEHEFTISDRYVAYNNDINSVSFGSSSKKTIPYSPKSIDDFDSTLIDLLLNFDLKESQWRQSILKASENFDHFCRTFDVNDQLKYLKAMLTSLFEPVEHPSKLAAACSIFISGTNYNQSNVTYGDMRVWLFEDFLEFFNIADVSGKEALKERIVERFKVFCKSIFFTTLINFDSIKLDLKESIFDIIDWLLYIFPNDQFINGKELGQ
ncbi:hypothetical protein [Paenibacillus sp. 2003]|uniref:hypothetical protein n=1 Tax=Paenibacillus sp. 2003 TaxID=2817761 RepID=UPI002860913E|nr:hypothetical protein [Paenibacillus sp. 2003]MDR6717405.1 hypothetical protein [Paenibacillus sp. 2003]